MELSEQNFGVSYTVTLAPGVVRYLKIQDFLQSDFEEALIRLRSLSKILEIESPEYVIYPASFGKAFTARFAKENERWNATRLDSAEYDNLLKNESWEERLRSHHKLGRLFLTEALHTSVYCSFFEFFRLKDHAFEECLNSWMKNALENDDIINSYRKSEEHLVVRHCVRDCELEFTFSKTPYVKARLDFLAQNEIERKAALDLDLLCRSKFSCYIYLMEDLRNKPFKIGKSKTPGKRERPLQSEVPQIVMRFSIPAEEAREKELHERFDAKRIRGEWFELSQDELMWLVSFLKSDGDTARSFVDFDWLGRIHFNS
jgi:hypothetical protein